jgi:hypothetical protein
MIIYHNQLFENFENWQVKWIYTSIDNWWVSIPDFKNHPNTDLDP